MEIAAAATTAVSTRPQPRQAAKSPSPSDDFAARLKEAGSDGALEKVGNFVDGIRADEARLDDAMRRMTSGRELDSVELLRTQSLVYGYAQRIELASKVVEGATSGLKQMLNTQV